MKKYLIGLIAVVLSSYVGVSASRGQSANFVYDDHSGVANAGSYMPGTSFTFTINLTFVPGGAINNLEGLSYWFQQNNPAPFVFSITLRDVSGSPFTDLQTAGLTYPQSLVPSNAKDLGALIPVDNTPLGAGTYTVANLTIAIDPAAANGVYTLQNVTSGGKTAFIFNSAGTGFAIPASTYTVTVVPEPTSLALVAAGLTGLLWFARRRATSVRV